MKKSGDHYLGNCTRPIQYLRTSEVNDGMEGEKAD
ncbi:hypothetical protein MASRES_GEN12903_17400 [Acinetobacter baumannii]